MFNSSPWAGVEPTTSVVIDIDCIGSCKSNYHTITATTPPAYIMKTDNMDITYIVMFYKLFVCS